ncbi:MAG: 50S ribosomal protein L28 [Alphaproteobacteria bacterium]|nr:50S ribosomal protein L28 [Alphaproteobacteria bacterium]MBQ3034948.1 50S ribosomal protein L28 [Alphaproteobacteria bacterium]MBR6730389.1 50S ribosomal protein L28 [Alphaproteobacteria bacterium]
MAKRCLVTGKGVQTGNNVSKSNRKTRRRFLPNLQSVAIYSEILDQQVTLKLSTQGLRTIEKNGGLDLYLLNTPVSKLTAESKEIRERIESAKAKKGL